jgi:hypothetical protein
MSEEFYIKEIKVLIQSVIPNEIDNSLENYENYLKSIKVIYNIQYIEPDLQENNGIINLACRQIINVEEYRLGRFIKFNEFKKEDFYPLIIESAASCEELQKIISHVRYKNGLEIKPIQNQNQNIRTENVVKYSPFQ